MQIFKRQRERQSLYTFSPVTSAKLRCHLSRLYLRAVFFRSFSPPGLGLRSQGGEKERGREEEVEPRGKNKKRQEEEENDDDDARTTPREPLWKNLTKLSHVATPESASKCERAIQPDGVYLFTRRVETTGSEFYADNTISEWQKLFATVGARARAGRHSCFQMAIFHPSLFGVSKICFLSAWREKIKRERERRIYASKRVTLNEIVREV